VTLSEFIRTHEVADSTGTGQPPRGQAQGPFDHGIQPRSWWGPLFGVTSKDLQVASQSVFGEPKRHPLLVRGLKRIVDLSLGTSLLILLSPLILLAILAIRTSSPGPAIFKQTRVGIDGRMFTMYKLRTMRFGGGSVELEQATSGHFVVTDDPRITRLGRLLRKFSLDEFPQFVNVIRGEMSLVGPRPALPDEVRQYNPHERRRLGVKPGMSGLWQVSGRSDLSWDESVRLDVLYVEQWSIALEVTIMARTPWAILGARGSY